MFASLSDVEEKLWKWENDGTEFYMEVDDEARCATALQLSVPRHELCSSAHACASPTLSQIRFRVHSVRFPTRPKSAEELRCVGWSECAKEGLFTRLDTRSCLRPDEGGMPGPIFAPMVVLVRPKRSAAAQRRRSGA